jgi:predicted type IV restriction endonuclease
MDFKDLIKQNADRIEGLKDKLLTEEATKNALIMPFISALGYDVFNPSEVLPEMTCDIGTKKGEKIDYAIMKDNEPIILIECKHWQQDLDLHESQLLRYFTVSKARFGILTNGIIYRFYTDLKEQNKMDEKPFLEINMLDLKDNQIEEIKKFHKSYFDESNILSSASELKYTGELKNVIMNEFNNPSSEFVKFFGKQVYEGFFTQKVEEQFTPIVKRSINSYINDLISDRLKAAIKENDNHDKQDETEEADNNETSNNNDAIEDRIVTTEEELEGFYAVKSILRNTIPTERITYKDTISYFTILIDNMKSKLVCRLYFNSSKNKQIVFIGDDKQKIKYKIDTIDDIYNYSQQLIDAATKYLE